MCINPKHMAKALERIVSCPSHLDDSSYIGTSSCMNSVITLEAKHKPNMKKGWNTGVQKMRKDISDHGMKIYNSEVLHFTRGEALAGLEPTVCSPTASALAVLKISKIL